MKQTPASRLRVLQFLIDQRYYQKHKIMDTLRSSPILLVGEGQRSAAPQDILDPDDPIGYIVPPDDPDAIYEDSAVNSQTARALSSLQLLRRVLDERYVEARIGHVASLPSERAPDAARRLLLTMDSTWFNCSGVRYDSELVWIPTHNGLRRPRECRDMSQGFLCDRVMPLLEMGPIRSVSLRKMLGWDEPIPLNTLIEQFRRVLSEPRESIDSRQLVELTYEFGRRVSSLSSAQFDEIITFSRSERWVLTDGGQFRKPSFAVFALDTPLYGFGLVSYTISSQPGTTEFLSRVGCAQRPTNSAMIEQSAILSGCEPSEAVALRCVQLLSSLDFPSLTDDERIRIVAPGHDHRLHDVTRLFYNDLGSRANTIEMPTDRVRVHQAISQSVKLCEDLRVPSLGSLHLNPLELVVEDMREDLTTRIRGVLRSYDIQQAFNEFLANAVDAGATKFNVMLDSDRHREARLPDILCQSIEELCTGPALVAHNDTEFTMEDIRGICRVGRGGKEGRDTTIGRFGLGSLTFYHFAEIAMILTGSYLLILDPSGRHLPERDGYRQNSYVVRLSNVKRIYPGQLRVFEGLFGFQSNADEYRGTIIRLPLRMSANPDALAGTCTPQRIRAMLSDYRSIASRSLFFVPVNEIIASESGRSSPMWSVSVRREDMTTDGTYQLQHLDITSVDNAKSVHRTSWRTVSAVVAPPLLEIPDWVLSIVAKHQLKRLSVALAAEVPSDSISDKAKRTRHFFSSLPLPISTSLPVHIHATFVLADDRRNIRWDGNGTLNPDSQFNHWLLSSAVPALYLSLIELWTRDFPDSVVPWPGSGVRDTADTLSKAVVDGFYSSGCLATTSRQVFRGVTGSLLDPSSAVICEMSKSDLVRNVLLQLRPPELVELPRQVRSSVLGLDSVKRVDRDYVRAVITHSRDAFIGAHALEAIRVSDIRAVILYIMECDRAGLPESPGDKLIGLPLLPLADGTLGNIERDGEGTSTIAHEWGLFPKPWPLFSAHHFLHPELDEGLLSDKGLNVTSLRSSGIVSLMQQKFVQASRREMSAEDRVWICKFWKWMRKFWQRFDADVVKLDDLTSFPLIPTIDHALFLSLHTALSDSAILPPSSLSEICPLANVLQKLGAVVVSTEIDGVALPQQVRTPLDNIAFIFWRVLKVLTHLNTDGLLPKNFERNISETERRQLGTWIRTSFETFHVGLPDDESLVDVVRLLPIWLAFRGSTSALRPLADTHVRLLPRAVGSVDRISLFLNPSFWFVQHAPEITKMKSAIEMSTADFLGCCQFPSHLRSDDMLSRYETLLDIILRLAAPSGNWSDRLQVPNEENVMVSVRSVYKSDLPEFRAAFSKRTDNFIHPRLRSTYEERLIPFGLRNQTSAENLKACVEAIDEDFDKDSEEDWETCLIVYRCYTTQLPLVVSEDRWWRQLDGYAFIPRHLSRRLGGSPQFAAIEFAFPLPLIVSPKKILRHEHSRVAWTQRALFHETPIKRLLMSDESVGIPSIEEVVKHLVVLTKKIAPRYPRDRELLKDIKATYEYLNDRHDEAKSFMLRHRREALFLNVNDPERETWKFFPANSIMFNVPDEDGRFEARAFLRPFRQLLLASGADEIQLPQVPVTQTPPAEEELSRLRTSFDGFRKGKILTDVRFTVTGGVANGVDDHWAHRDLLSAASRHFEDLFCGGFGEGRAASSEDPVILTCDDALELKCVGLVLDHIYTGQFDESQDRECLIGLLRLAHRWEIAQVQSKAEALLVKTLTPGTYLELRDYANEVDAQLLLDKIEEFETQNAFALKDFM